MIKALFFIGIGAIGAHLYLTGDVDGAMLMIKEITHDILSMGAEATK